MAPTILGLQCLNRCIQYVASQPHKSIFCPYYYYYGSNVIRLTWSGNSVEYYTTQNFIECHEYEDNDRTINRRRSVSGIFHTLLGIEVFWKAHIQPDVASDSTDG